MLEGTQKLFPSDYEEFIETVMMRADEGELPIALQLKEPEEFTIKDFQDLFLDIEYDTGLDVNGSFTLCPDCGTMHVIIEVDYPEEESKEKILQ